MFWKAYVDLCESLGLSEVFIGYLKRTGVTSRTKRSSLSLGRRSEQASELWRTGFEALLRRGFDYTVAFRELATIAELQLADATLSPAELIAPLMSARRTASCISVLKCERVVSGG